MPTRHRYDPRALSAGWWVAIAAVLLAGFVTADQVAKDTDCFPGRPAAAPGSVEPGATVRITATGFPCDRRYHRGAFYGLEFRSASTTEAVDLGMFPVAQDGSFDAEVAVPEDARPGTGSFHVTGFDIREVFAEVCDDGSGGCAPYAAGVRVT